MLQSQRAKLQAQKATATMKQVAKGGPQLSGFKKPAAAPTKGGALAVPNVRATTMPARVRASQPAAPTPKWTDSKTRPSAPATKSPTPQATKPSSSPLTRPTAPSGRRTRVQGRVVAKGRPPSKATTNAANYRTRLTAAEQQGKTNVQTAVRNRARIAAGYGKGAKELARLKGGLKLAGRAAELPALYFATKDVIERFNPNSNRNKEFNRMYGALASRQARKRIDKQTGVTNAQIRNAVNILESRRGKGKPPTPSKPSQAPSRRQSGSPGKSSSLGSIAKRFDSAFAAARKSGKSVFTFDGKKYNTKLRGEK